MRQFLKLGLVGLVLVISCAQAFAADDDDEFFQSVSRTSAEKSRGRNYPGARDEQNIEIQTSLNMPSRSADGSNALPVEGADERPAQAPASD